MFNNKFIILSTLFGARVKCISPVTQSFELDGVVRRFNRYSLNELCTITGIIQTSEGLSVFIKSDGVDCEENEPLSLIEQHFSLLD